MAERDGIIVERKNRGFAFAARVEAVLFVITDAHDGAQNAIVAVLAFAERAESSFGGEVVHIVDAIFDEIGRLDLVHLELRLRTVKFNEQGFKQTIAFGCGVSGGHGGIGRGPRIAGSGAGRRKAQCEHQGENECRSAVK